MNVGQAPRQIEDGETCGRANAFIALQNTSTDVIDNIVHSEKYCTRSQHDNLGLERAAVVADIGPAPLPHEHRQRTAGPINQPRLGVQRCAVVSIERFVPRIVASVLTGSTSKSSQVKPIYSSSDGRTTAFAMVLHVVGIELESHVERAQRWKRETRTNATNQKEHSDLVLERRVDGGGKATAWPCSACEMSFSFGIVVLQSLSWEMKNDVVPR